MSEDLQQNISLKVVAKEADFSGITRTKTEVLALKAVLEEVRALTLGLGIPKGIDTSVQRLTALFSQVQSKSGALNIENLSRALSVEADAVKRFIDAQKSLAGFTKSSGEFRGPLDAARAMSQFAKEFNAQRALMENVTRKLFQGGFNITGAVAAAAASGGGGGGGSSGGGGGGGGVQNPDVSGEAAAKGSGGGGGGKGKRTVNPVANGGAEVRRRHIETEKYSHDVVTRLGEFGRTVTETMDEAGKILKSITDSPVGREAIKDLRLRRRLLANDLRVMKASGQAPEGLLRHAEQLGGVLTPEVLAALGPADAARMRQLLDSESAVARAEAARLTGRAARRQQTDAERMETQRRRREEADRKERERQEKASEDAEFQRRKEAHARNKSEMGPDSTRSQYVNWWTDALNRRDREAADAADAAAQEAMRTERRESKSQFNQRRDAHKRNKAEMSTKASRSQYVSWWQEQLNERDEEERRNARFAAERRAASIEARQRWEQEQEAHAEAVRARQIQARNRAFNAAYAAAQRPTPLQRNLQSFTPEGMGMNLLRVSGWAGAVGLLYGGLNVAKYGAGQAIGVQSQEARLGQVFRGVGGTSQELTRDVLRLAAATNRSTDEAMEAAVEWSRLGLTKKEVNEAVTVSLKAANVAEITAGEATMHLSAIMSSYQLRVEDLNSVLGMLNSTSNQFNVRNKDLLEGIARVGSVAKQAGISLAELQGLIGSVVGRTGQSGANVGNALKALTVSVSDPTVQGFLSERYGMKFSRNEHGEIKEMSRLLGDLWVTYEKLNNAERQNLLVRVAGKNQASRVAAVMDGYIKAQELAYQGTQNLNSAEAENAKIMGTVKSQWEGLKSAFGGSAHQVLTQSGALNVTGQLLRLGKHSLDPEIWGAMFKNPATNALGDALGWINDRLDGPDLVNRTGLLERRSDSILRAEGEGIRANALKRILERWNGDSSYAPGDLSGLGVTGTATVDSVTAAYNDARMQQRIQADAASAAGLAALANLDAELTKLKAVGKEKAKIAKLEKDRLEIQGQVKASWDSSEEAGDGFNLAPGDKRKLAILSSAGGILGDARMSVAGPGMISRLAAQRLAARDQVSFFDSVLKSPGLSVGMEAQVRSMQESASTELARLSNPASAMLATMMDRRSMNQRYAALEFRGFGTGQSEAEQLANRAAGLSSVVGDARRRAGSGSMNDQERTRAMEAEVQLMETQMRIQEALVDLRREEVNIIREGQKEFSRQALHSGPDELLRKMAVNSLVSRGRMDVGGYMSLSPEARADVDLLTGGESLRQNRRDQKRLSGFEMPLIEAQQRYAEMQEHITRLHEVQGNRLSEMGQRVLEVTGSLKLLNAQLQAMGLGQGGTNGAPPVTGRNTL